MYLVHDEPMMHAYNTPTLLLLCIHLAPTSPRSSNPLSPLLPEPPRPTCLRGIHLGLVDILTFIWRGKAASSERPFSIMRYSCFASRSLATEGGGS